MERAKDGDTRQWGAILKIAANAVIASELRYKNRAPLAYIKFITAAVVIFTSRHL